jgi:hypothetical protein
LGRKCLKSLTTDGVENTLLEALIKLRERFPKLRVEMPQYMSESDAVDGSHPAASSCRITVLLPIVRRPLMAISVGLRWRK